MISQIRQQLRDRLIHHIESLGKPAWRPMLTYLAELHARAVHEPVPPFPHPWEEIGPGYWFAPAFGHWDIIFQSLDVVPADPDHARRQIDNYLATQQPDGRFPVVYMFRDGRPTTTENATHPPIWPIAVDELRQATSSDDLLPRAYDALVRQIEWIEARRRATDRGFYYLDILEDRWESGVDEGIRFIDRPAAPGACVDATCHMYLCLDAAARWSEILGESLRRWREEAEELARIVREKLFCTETGLFHDAWTVDNPSRRVLTFESIWALVAGVATEAQAGRVIDENLLNPKRFFAAHPITTVAMEDPRFELRMWRGPAWNSMTYWAARGCVRCGRRDAARQLLERALDGSAEQFGRTGTIWEFYHPHGGEQRELRRKTGMGVNQPSRDYIAHNPLLAMARLWAACGG